MIGLAFYVLARILYGGAPNSLVLVFRVHSYLRFIRRELLCEIFVKQECIPVGCVLSAAVAICRGGLPQCMLGYTPWAWAWTPPWADTPTPLGLGLDTPNPTVNRMTDRCKNITFPQLRLRTVITGCTVLSGCIHTYYLVDFSMNWKVLYTHFSWLRGLKSSRLINRRYKWTFKLYSAFTPATSWTFAITIESTIVIAIAIPTQCIEKNRSRPQKVIV